MKSDITEIIRQSIQLKQDVLDDDKIIDKIHQIAILIIDCYKNGGKVLFCGNGGSAADAQHLAAELSGRFYYDRKPLSAEALHVNTSYLTAVANDYAFDQVYARLVEGAGKAGDILIGLSTSGNSPNVLNAFKVAKSKGITAIALTGEGGGKLSSLCDHCISVPSKDTPRIQEVHILIGHIICMLVERSLFPDSNTNH